MSTTAVNLAVQNSIELIDWSKVRSVYRKLHTDFHVLTAPFGIKISAQMNQDLAHLISLIDAVDRDLDELKLLADRQAFGHAVVAYLKGDLAEIDTPTVSKELALRLCFLREIVERRNIAVAFADAVAAIFDHTEAKRQTADVDDMFKHLTIEGWYTGRLPILVMHGKTTPAFENFFCLFCELMTVVDMIQDARSDYRNDEIKVRPGVSLYGKLLAAFVLPLPKLFYRFPKPLKLVKYCLSFLHELYFKKG